MNTLRFFSLSLALVMATAFGVDKRAFSDDTPASASVKEQVLLDVLRSEAPKAEKAITCKNLAIYGSSESVAELAKLLTDPQLASWARIALEVIPGPAADQALLAATDELDGLLLVGTINSIGVRRDANAVEKLTARLQDSDAEVASAAAVALGLIGDSASSKSLRQALAAAPADVRSAIAEGCVLCAERSLADGNADDAIAIYDEVRKADVPSQRVLEATRGAILARGQDGIPLLIEQFRSPEKSMFQLALGTAREFPGDRIDQALAEEMVKSDPSRAALIVHAMADRPDTVVLTAITKAAQQGDKHVRVAAIDALKRVGDESCMPALLEIAVDSDADLAQAARETLASLPGEKVDSQLVSQLVDAPRDSSALLIELVGKRRIDAVPELLKFADDSDSDVRHAALVALGETVSLKRLSVLVDRMIKPKYSEDAAVAQLALKSASVRMPDREACAAELALAVEQSSAAAKASLLEILSEVGGSTALQTLASAAESDDPQLQDTASRLLGKWSGIDAAPVLLDLASNAPSEKYQVRALRGYISLARRFAMPEPQRVEMCRKAMDVTERLPEQELALDVLQLHPSRPGLELAMESLRQNALNEKATHAAIVIAQALVRKKDGLANGRLEIVKATYGAGAQQKDVTSVLEKQAGDLPMICLASGNYNTSFGGDPAPGSVKQLNVKYRIDGVPGEATFTENALIIFPLPKR
ncbi:MAG: HEAT repeat domain-containing protein [Rubripirellula sp.]